jgi:Reverse transcriptase (RNA-dependent DNA polymerase)
MHIPKSYCSKLSLHSKQCTFIGLATNYKAFKLIHRASHKIYHSCDVVFNKGGPKHERVVIDDDDNIDYEHDNGDTTVDGDAAPPAIPPPVPPSVTRPMRTIRAPICDNDPRYDVTSYNRTPVRASVAESEIGSDPRTFDEAMARPDATKWRLACGTEQIAFEQMGVYEVVPCPRGRKVVSSHWVFRVKRGPDGSIQKYKARVVAQGFTQIEGIDFDETFTPVAKLTSLCTILAIAAEKDFELQQMDVKSAYLNGTLKEEIFMNPSPGFDIPDGMVLRLIKAVYGTKQGGRVWYENIKARLTSMGYQNTQSDHAVFTRFADPHTSIIVLYVDNITMASSSLQEIQKDKALLCQYYKMTNLGDLAWILGMHVTHDRDTRWISLSQEKYLNEVLERFGKSSIRPISTPAIANEHLHKLSQPESDAKLYQSAVGALMYLMVGTCPDLSYAVLALRRHNAMPGPSHLHSLECVFKYLCGSMSLRLTFRRGTPEGTVLRGFVDADWASDINDRKSTSGFAFMLGGGAISWGSKKQTSVALSSTEAKYVAAAYAVKEAVWLQRLLRELNLDVTLPTILHMDNQSAIAIARNPEFHDRTKHIDLRHHFLCERVATGDIDLTYIPTNDQIADVFTKGLVREKHGQLMHELGLHFQV